MIRGWLQILYSDLIKFYMYEKFFAKKCPARWVFRSILNINWLAIRSTEQCNNEPRSDIAKQAHFFILAILAACSALLMFPNSPGFSPFHPLAAATSNRVCQLLHMLRSRQGAPRWQVQVLPVCADASSPPAFFFASSSASAANLKRSNALDYNS